MLSKELKKAIFTAENIARVKAEIKKYNQLKAISNKAYKTAYKAREEANNFYWHKGELYEATTDGYARHELLNKLCEEQNKAKTAEKIAKHNEKIQARFIIYLVSYMVAPYWWELKDKKGIYTVFEELEKETGERFAVYSDGESIREDRENSYLYYTVYFNGFKHWQTFSDGRIKNLQEPTAPHFATVSEYLRLQAKQSKAVKEAWDKLKALEKTFSDLNYRDLLGEWSIKADLYSYND